jgi:hypothetical protein
MLVVLRASAGRQCDVSNLLLALRQDVAFRLKGAAESDLRRSEVEQQCLIRF